MASTTPVRTRIAPSPTGDPHVGTAYIALFNWAFARQHGGEFLLRIEDTDQARSNSVSEAAILDSLRWLGLDWDEGPDVGGPHGPYRQSERKASYAKHAERLIDAGHAFVCFCTPERLDEVRRGQQARGETTRYDGHCRGLDHAEVSSRVSNGEAHVVRLVVPEEGDCTCHDALRGEIVIPWQQIDMQVLLKADGMPTYHLAVVVDDHDMAISHVLRGEEWISSLPKHQLLYEYLGWDMPVHAHLPLLRNPDSSKLSKRKNPTSIRYYQQVGFLGKALANYLSLMGWSMPDEREIFSINEFAEAFDLERVSLGGPVFDQAKLSWLNGQYLRALEPDAFMDEVSRWMLNRERLAELVPLVQQRTERLGDLATQVDYLIGDRRPLTETDFEHKSLSGDDCLRVLHHVSKALDSQSDWSRDVLYELCDGLAKAMDMKIRDWLFPLFIAISGRAVSLPLFDSLAYLGPDVSRVRLREAMAALGGVSKKAAKRLEKDYASLGLSR